jgi:hypothetical protein
VSADFYQASGATKWKGLEVFSQLSSSCPKPGCTVLSTVRRKTYNPHSSPSWSSIYSVASSSSNDSTSRSYSCSSFSVGLYPLGLYRSTGCLLSQAVCRLLLLSLRWLLRPAAAMASGRAVFSYFGSCHRSVTGQCYLAYASSLSSGTSSNHAASSLILGNLSCRSSGNASVVR